MDRSHADAKALSVRIALVGARHADVDEASCEVGHGGCYEQRRADGSVDTALRRPRVSTRSATFERLVGGEPGDDDPLTDPRSLAFWGRGVGGRWWLRVADRDRDGLDLSGLIAIQVWTGYLFTRE